MLIKYEFLKILRRKSTLIVMVVSLIVTAFLFGLPIMQYQTYNQDGVIKGSDGISYNKEQSATFSVLLTDERPRSACHAVPSLLQQSDQ